MKPTLLFICGWPHAATSPLTYTLQRLAKYAHGGYDKNLHYLAILSDDPSANDWVCKLKELHKKILFNRWENFSSNRSHKLNRSEDLAPLKGFNKKYIANMSRLPYTIEKYIDYYNALWEQVKPYGFKAVADFQEHEDNVLPFASILQKHFDVKVLLIARDPIRRAIGKAKWYSLKHPNIIQNNRFTDLDTFVKDYTGTYKRVKESIPNTLMIVMEELWEGDGTEKELLSTFLGSSIDNLWTNLYSPDTGHHLTWNLETTYCPTPCQVPGQSCFELTSSYYNELREQYKHHYDSWIDTFGSLPLHWGRPIDYEKNYITK